MRNSTVRLTFNDYIFHISSGSGFGLDTLMFFIPLVWLCFTDEETDLESFRKYIQVHTDCKW